MKAIFIVLLLLQGVPAASITAGGHINADATWNTDTVLVTDTLTVDSGVTLTVAPGTRVEFQGYFKFRVRGRVLAQGLQTDSIVFTAKDTAAGWRGIRFENISAANDTSRFSCCRIEYGRVASGAGQEFWGAGFYLETPAKARIEHCLIQRNSGESYGGGLYVGSSAVALLNSTIRENRAATGAGICLNGGSAVLIGNTIAANTATATGGGITSRYSSPRFINNTITGNTAVNGGGLHISLAPVTLVNCRVSGNTATSQGGGIFCPDSLLKLFNCTVANNRAAAGAGGLYASTTNAAASPVLVNTVFWGNVANTAFNQLSLNNPTVRPDIRNCDIQGGLPAVTGNGVPRVYRGNFDLYPLFADSAAGDYSIAAASPCVNAGAPDTTGLGLPGLDLAGNPRIFGGAAGRVDAGAFEAQADPAGNITVTAPAGGDSLIVQGVYAVTWASTGTVGNVKIEFSADSCRTWQTIAASTPNTGSFNWTVPVTISAGCVVRISQASTGAPFDESDGLFTLYDPARLCGWIMRDTVWDSDTVKVGCPVYIDTGVTLTINPGTRVLFMGPYPLKVRGRLLAQGLVSDSIIFTAADTSAGWRGIRFDSLSAANDTSRIDYCRIQYARASGSTLDGYGGGVYINGFSKVIVARSTIRNNSAINGGAGICAWSCSPVIRGNTIRNNRTTDATFSFGAGVFCVSSSAEVSGNVIISNSSSREGGGIAVQGGSPRIVNTRIELNTAGNEGGGIRCIQAGSPIITGCLIRGNSAYDGGGAFANGSNLVFRNSTVVNNRASIGPGLKLETSSAQVRNSIIWNNGISYSGSVVNVEYSCLVGYAGTGTINADPRFVDSAGGNFQLAEGSPCVNAGNRDTTGLSLPALDLAGNARIHGNRIDMGAYESQWDDAPDFGAFNAQNATEGTRFTLTVCASGFPLPVHSLISAAPAGLALDSLTGVIQWTPGYTQAGRYDLLIRAVNPGGADTAALSIAVANTKLPCVLLRPANGDTISDDSLLEWERSADPDLNAAVYYRMRLYRDSLYTRLIAEQDSLQDTVFAVSLLDSLPEDTVIFWTVEAYDTGGYSTGYSAVKSWFYYKGPSTRLERGALALPECFSLSQNLPNPFNLLTRIRIGIPAAGGKVPVSLRIYDTGGRLVRNLFEGDLAPGFHGFQWNGLDDGKGPVTSGFYLIKLRAGSFQRVIRCMLMK